MQLKEKQAKMVIGLLMQRMNQINNRRDDMSALLAERGNVTDEQVDEVVTLMAKTEAYSAAILHLLRYTAPSELRRQTEDIARHNLEQTEIFFSSSDLTYDLLALPRDD